MDVILKYRQLPAFISEAHRVADEITAGIMDTAIRVTGDIAIPAGIVRSDMVFRPCDRLFLRCENLSGISDLIFQDDTFCLIMIQWFTADIRRRRICALLRWIRSVRSDHLG